MCVQFFMQFFSVFILMYRRFKIRVYVIVMCVLSCNHTKCRRPYIRYFPRKNSRLQILLVFSLQVIKAFSSSLELPMLYRLGSELDLEILSFASLAPELSAALLPFPKK